MLSDRELWEAASCLDLEKIAAAYPTFEWRRKRLPEAWGRRLELECKTQKWLEADPPISGRDIAEEIYKWGFGKNTFPGSSDNGWHEAFRNMMAAWHRPDDQAGAEISLARMLAYPGLGIASVSKWLCFIDQDRFAIFDSRVSRALRHVQIGGQRIFPIVPGRVPKNGGTRWVTADISKTMRDSERKMAAAYGLYLRLLKMIAPKTGMRLAQVEMALFMLGKGLPHPPEAPLPFARSIYH